MSTLPQNLSLFDGKPCRRCGEWKPFSQFHKKAKSADGLAKLCILCVRAYKKAQRDARSDQQRAKELQKKRDHYHANAEQITAQRREKAKQNAERLKSLDRTTAFKVCRTCRENKPLTEFFNDPYFSTGFPPDCRTCVARYVAPVYWQRRKALGLNLANAKRRVSALAYYYRNKDDCLERGKEWARKNRVHRNHLSQIKQHRRLALKRNNGGSFTRIEWESLCAKYDYRCLRCGERKRLSVDHVIPVSKGGPSTIDNIQPLCRSCNSSKGPKYIDYRR